MGHDQAQCSFKGMDVDPGVGWNGLFREPFINNSQRMRGTDVSVHGSGVTAKETFEK